MLDITKWNLTENREYFLCLADNSPGIAVDLYHTQTDAQAATNRQASGASDDYGTAVEIVLILETGGNPEMLQPQYGWHLVAAGQAGDASRILRVGLFVELPEISHAIYRDARLIERRATAEIDAHTHADIARTVALGIHLPEVEPGDIVRLNSARRNKDVLGQVNGHRIAGELNSLTSELDVSFYKELTR